MIAVDVDGDGRKDLVTANYGAHSVSLLINTTVPGASTLSFAPEQTIATETYSYFIAAADVNNDGKPDLIVASPADNLVSVLLNTQLQATIINSAATGTIVHDYLFANGFE